MTVTVGGGCSTLVLALFAGAPGASSISLANDAMDLDNKDEEDID